MRHALPSLLLALAVSSPALADDAPTPAEAPAPEASGLDDFREQLRRMQRELDEAKKRLEAQEKELATQRRGLADVRLKQAPKDLKFDISGYWRVRSHTWGTGSADEGKGVRGGLYADQPTSSTYFQQRLRVGLKASWKDVASLNVAFMGFDDVVWGDNDDLSRTALFASTPSITDIEGQEVPAFELFRAWTEFKIPVGVFRLGRQPMHLGLGILANDGDGFRNDFGEAHYGSNLDRLLFATNPVKIAQTFTKKQERYEVPMILAIAYDKLVTDPRSQYYGFKCSPGKVDGDPGFDARCDLDGDGLTDVDHDYQGDPDDRTRTASWWANQRDDVQQMVYALVFKGENVPVYKKDEAGKDVKVDAFNLTTGLAGIHRWQRETKSQVGIIDAFVDASYKGLVVQGEAVGIVGRTRAIVLPSSEEDPLAKKAAISGYAARVGYDHPQFKVLFESGFSSGDENVNDGKFTGRALDPDYNVGFILYEEVMRHVTDTLWAGNARGLRSRGGVYNSHYLNPRVYVYPYNNTQIIAGAVVAFPDRPDGAIILCDEKDAARVGCLAAPGSSYSRLLGYELDLAVKHTFDDRINVSFETGYAHATNRVPLDVVGLNPKGNFWTFQARAAWVF